MSAMMRRMMMFQRCLSTQTKQQQQQQRTIFALSSGAGKAGVALIRISGANAGESFVCEWNALSF